MENIRKLCLNEKEILDILKCDFVSNGYNRNSNNESGFTDTWVDYFYRYEGAVRVSVNEAKEILYNHLMDTKNIDNTFMKHSAKIILSHSWGNQDDDGIVVLYGTLNMK